MSILEINGGTSVCLIIGDPVAHSLSPRMHNAAYHAAGVSFVMAAARVTSEALPDAIRGIRALGIRGLACTMPHKVSLSALLDEVDQTAATIGAVNTVVNHDGTLVGYNTDWLGILRPLEHRTNVKGKRVAVLGAGGAAQAAVYACTSQGAEVTVFNRTVSKARSLGDTFGVTAQSLDPQQPIADFDIVINTTAVGMGPRAEQSPITPEQLAPHQIVFETIYHPHETLLLKHAAARGASIIQGLEMFLEQGAAQFELHTGVKAPRGVMKSILQSTATS